MAQKKTCQTTIRVPEYLLKDMQELAFLTKVPMNQTIIKLLEDSIPELLKLARKAK